MKETSDPPMPIEPRAQSFFWLSRLKRALLLACLTAALSNWSFAEIPEVEPTLQEEQATLPDAPTPTTQVAGDKAGTGGTDSGKTDIGKPDAGKADAGKPETPCKYPPCFQPTNWYMRFVNGPQVSPMTPKQKAWLATRNFLDPFNALTILGEGAIYLGANSHTDYGPGMAGFGRYVGVGFTQDLTGEFFNTFLIPSVMHQDPHYHRMPHATYPRRVAHAIGQVVWTQGDNGKGMLNYANLVGYAIDDEISNLYVPGRETNGIATAQRYGIALATAPIGNLITEFLPDLARHVHVQIVVVQRIINQVAKTDQ